MKQLSLVLLFLSFYLPTTFAAPVEPLLSVIERQKPSFLSTLKDLVSIESGSRDSEGLEKISSLIFNRLKDLGGKVEYIEPGKDTYQMLDTPQQPGRMVKAVFQGTGTKKILLIAHMDTVYLRGMLANQPFRIDQDRAYGLGIADDKQGIALILHTIETLKKINFQSYGQITVLITGDEEISSPASRATLTKLGAEHDVTLSCEATLAKSDRLELTTAGIASVNLSITGKASHAGAAPEQGRNALDELAFQILQTRDLSDKEKGIKLNWTLATAGTNRNVIPSQAQATADVRVLNKEDFDIIEGKVKERIKKQLIPDTKVAMSFELRRPPLVMNSRSIQLAEEAKQIYAEVGRDLLISKLAVGGGTDAAFAALNTQSPVLERMGIQGFGSHSNDDEYILISSITPRIYLMSRLIMEIANKK